MNLNEKIAIYITEQAGSMKMFWYLACWYLFWIILNISLGKYAFDNYPFPLLLFFGNALQLLWLPVISVGQNVQSRKDRVRSLEMEQIVKNQVSIMSAMLDIVTEIRQGIKENKKSIDFDRELAVSADETLSNVRQILIVLGEKVDFIEKELDVK